MANQVADPGRGVAWRRFIPSGGAQRGERAPIADAVQQHGDGHGIAYVTEDPRLYHLVIESSGLDWTIAVQEAVVGTPP